MPRRYSAKQYASGIVVPLLVLALGVLGYFLLLPKYKDVRLATQQVKAKQTALDAKKASLGQIRKLTGDYEQKKDQLKTIDESLPAAPRIPELLANIDYLAKQSGLTISTLQIIPAPSLATATAGQQLTKISKTDSLLKSADNLTAMQLNVVFKGQYVNLKTFLANLEQNLRLLDIRSMTFGGVDEDSGLQEYALEIQTYYQKTP